MNPCRTSSPVDIMADPNSSSSSDTPDHLRTNIPSGGLEHGHPGQHAPARAGGVNEKAPAQDEPEEEEEDIDALIAELESEDGGEEEEEEAAPGMSARPIPEELLQTDTRKGLTSQEVTDRRKKYGLNQMAEEKENMFKKFLMYFVGPIQFVMEV
jgi:H+-transporting ATPase